MDLKMEKHIRVRCIEPCVKSKNKIMCSDLTAFYETEVSLFVEAFRSHARLQVYWTLRYYYLPKPWINEDYRTTAGYY